MIKKFIKIFLYLSFFSAIITNAQWVIQQSPSFGVYKASFVNVNTGTVVGENGAVLRTTNGGINWVSQSGATYLLEDVQMLDVNTGYASGWGPVIKTTNGGANWITLNTPYGIIYYGLSFIDVNTGYSCGTGGTIIKTTNGGTNWIQQTDTTTYDLIRVKFYDANTGYTVGIVGTILKTTNGGNVWAQLVSGTTAVLRSLSIINSNTVFVCGDGINVLETTDGGNTFLPLTNSPIFTNMFDIYFTNANTGTVAGSSPFFSRTTNGGLNWSNQINPSNLNIYGVYFVTNDTGYAVGNGVLMRTNTGGFSPPHPPTLQLPVNGAQNVSITPHLKWDTVSGADVYNVQIAADSSFNSPLFDSSGIADTFYNVRSGLLSNNFQYFWRVRSHNFVSYGAWSLPFNFTTIVGIPAPPTLLLPVYAATNVSLNPLFNGIVRVLHYIIGFKSVMIHHFLLTGLLLIQMEFPMHIT